MDLDALAALAANTLVTVALSDTFEALKAKVTRLFGRGNPDPAAGRRLDTTRRQLAATAPEDLKGAQATQVRQWETRFADLLADHPEAAQELRALLAEFGANSPAGGNVANTISGTVHGPVLMGRDFGDITLSGQDGLSRPNRNRQAPNSPVPVPARRRALSLSGSCRPPVRGQGLLRRILGVVVPNNLNDAKKLSNDRGNVRFVLGGW
jgi:hypothetical protein